VQEFKVEDYYELYEGIIKFNLMELFQRPAELQKLERYCRAIYQRAKFVSTCFYFLLCLHSHTPTVNMCMATLKCAVGQQLDVSLKANLIHISSYFFLLFKHYFRRLWVIAAF